MSDWHPEDIKAEVRKRAGSLEALARAAGLTGKAIGLALVLPRADAERVIADLLQLHPMTIWPSRYDSSGERLQPQPRRNYARPERQPQSARAAA